MTDRQNEHCKKYWKANKEAINAKRRKKYHEAKGQEVPQAEGMKRARQLANLTQEQLGQRIGRSRHTVRAYEKGLIAIPKGILKLIIKHIGKF